LSDIEVKVPDIGDFHDVPIIEILVKPGDQVKPEQSLMTLESTRLRWTCPPRRRDGQRDRRQARRQGEPGNAHLVDGERRGRRRRKRNRSPSDKAPAAAAAATEVKVPDIGDFKDVPIIEILVKPGDAVKAEQPLMTLESDKASMDVPAPSDGVVGELRVKVGDKVSQEPSS